MAPLIEAPAHLSPPRAINTAEILSRERIIDPAWEQLNQAA
jgi:hypothetical protein